MRIPLRLVLVLGAALAAPMTARVARAADHGDGPGVLRDPSTDITDVFAWMSGDGHLRLAMAVYPSAPAGAKFSNAAVYAFHTNAFAAYGDTPGVTRDILCRFQAGGAAQPIECWGPGGEYVTGDASAPSGIASPSGKLRVFAGPRDDAFYWNRDGFNQAVTAVKQGVPMDPRGCPTTITSVSKAVTAVLLKGTGGAPGLDSFRKGGSASVSGNVLAIVVTIDKSLVSDDQHTLVGAWAATHVAR